MLLVFAMTFGYAAASYAYGPGHGAERGGKGRCHFGEEGKFYGTAMLILRNKEELGLTDEQVDKIKVLKVETKKSLIRQNAEIDIVSVDLKAAEWEDPIDTAAVNKLIDKKYDLKKESFIKDYAPYQSYSNLFQRMPIPLLKVAGSVFYRHIA